MYIIVLATAANKKEAEKISGALVEKRLAACVNIIDKIDSLFFWKSKIDRAKESLMIIKTKKEKFPAVSRLIKSLHSYEVPEIIAIPVVLGDKTYLEWLDASVRRPA